MRSSVRKQAEASFGKTQNIGRIERLNEGEEFVAREVFPG